MSPKVVDSIETIAQELEGKRIKELFRHADIVADLHTTLTSKRGNYFRKRLLHKLGEGAGTDLLEQLRKEADVREQKRHLDKLLQFKLIEQGPAAIQETYLRTVLGETAVNALRELERDIEQDKAREIYEASLGPHSIRLFLRVYSDKREPDFTSRKLKYTPQEVGSLAFFLPRSVEALAAIDKLNEAGLLAYEEDGGVYAAPILLRGFYKYLIHLYEILVETGLLPKKEL